MMELCADPAGTLQRSGIRFAAPKKYRRFLLAGMVAIFLPALMMYKTGFMFLWSDFLALIAGTALVAFTVVAVLPFGVELVLTVDGIRLRRRATEVFCPWSLFNVSGNVLARPNELVLPIAAQAIPFVQQYDNERLVRQGVQVQTPLLRFQKGTEMVLLPQFTAPPEELGRLLLYLGRALGNRLPTESVPAEACPSADAPESALFADQKNGWMTVSLTALKFPPICCNCGVSADQVWSLWAGFRHVDALGGLAYYREKITVRVPICGPCLREVEQQQWRGRQVGTRIGLAVVVVGTLLVLPWRAAVNQVALVFFGVAAAVIVPTAGLIIGAVAADRRLPVRAARYSGSKNTVALWFRQPAYADSIRALMQNQGGPGTHAVAVD
jgi:hypothetical protein